MAEGHRIARSGQRSQGPLVVLLVILLLLGLPFAAWLDMRDLSERILRRQAE
jgi:adenylate cyclase